MPRALWAGVVLAVVGLLLLSGVPGGSALGNALVLANAVFQAFQITAMERFAPRYDPRALTFLQMATSFVGFTVIALALGELEVPRGATVWGALLVTGIFAGALGYLIATWVQARTTAARAALVFTLEAPFAALFGVLLADEILGWAGWLGCAVMMAAILVAEPAAAATLRRLASLTVCSRQSMSAVLLALSSAFLFGATTVAMRVAFRGGALAEGGALFTVLTALAVRCRSRLAQGGPVARVVAVPARGAARPGRLADPLHVRGARGGCVADVGRDRHGAAVLRRDRRRLPRRAARGGARRWRGADRGGRHRCSPASASDPSTSSASGSVSRSIGDDRLRGAGQLRPLARRCDTDVAPGLAASRDADGRRGR